ncbi:Metallopeptidase-like protein 2 [Elsinoe fawcettii]|nr:Metallopeptidase-like protein 2 [Elsinoe fawcettii]
MDDDRQYSGETMVAEKQNAFKDDRHPVPRLPQRPTPRLRFKIVSRLAVAAVLLSAVIWLATALGSKSHITFVHDTLSCTTKNLHQDLSFLDHAIPINTKEFLARRDRLAVALSESGADAFVLEPGYTFQYYGNISQTDWEPWEPEERPFLMVIEVAKHESGIKAKTSFLAPSFEVGRVRMLGIPSDSELNVIPWEEHWDPYATLHKSLFDGRNVTVMIDDEMRDYISRGLQVAGLKTIGLSKAVEEVRQIKSLAEVELLRAVNTGTVQGIRAMQPCLKSGLRERDLIYILDKAMKSIGFQNFFNIVLFDENAALPHGGFATGDKILNRHTMILIDVGYHYLGYSSDVCRSFFMRPSDSLARRRFFDTFDGVHSWWSSGSSSGTERWTNELRTREKKKVWDIVFQAQSAAGNMFRANNSCASVDIAARSVIEKAGYNGTFTHRVGHGIGIKAHEPPYLNKANTKILLKPGMTFTNEPGIYLEGKFGVRHEDIYLVTEGEPEILSGQRASGPYDP